MPVRCSNYGELCITSGYSQKFLFVRAIHISAILKTVTIDDLLCLPLAQLFQRSRDHNIRVW